MGNLFTAVRNAANAISVYDRQLAVIQNNVANANTPGYVRQVQTVDAMRFDVAASLPGGVAAGPVVNARSEFAEEGVRNQVSQQGYSQQKSLDLAPVEPMFDPSSTSGVAGALTAFFTSFSQLSINPNDPLARTAVIERARTLAGAFNTTAERLSSTVHHVDTQIADTVGAINRLGGELRDFNAIYRANSSNTGDAGLDARVHAKLEELSELTNFSVVRSGDGATTVYVGGTPLVVGDHLFPLSTVLSPQQSVILDTSGGDVTGQIGTGKLGALLNEKNVMLPSYSADLDTLAATLADRVNGQLAAGVDSNGAAPTTSLFQYDGALGVAASLSVTAIRPAEIAAATPEAPGGNGNALTLASMLGSKTTDGFTFVEYFGALGGRVGRAIASAREGVEISSALATQARSFRQELSGVSLDQEAALLLQVQRAYQASAKLLSVLNEITDTIMKMQ